MRGAYLASVSTLLALAIAGVVAWLWVIDPYGIYGERPPPSTPYGADLFWYVRLHKPYALEQLRPEQLIIGSSRAARLDPALLAEPGRPVYNAALPGTSLVEMRRVLEHAQSVGPVTKAVVGLDYYLFRADNPNAVFQPERLRRLEPTPTQAFQRFRRVLQDRWESLFSLRALLDAWDVATGVRRGQRLFYPDGTWVVQVAEKMRGEAAYSWMARYKRREYAAPGIEELDMREFGALLDFAQTHHIELDLLILPLHAIPLQAIERAGSWPAYLRWQRRVVEFAQAHPLEVRVFGLENSEALLTDAMKAAEPLFRDGVHSTARAGGFITSCLGLSEASCNGAVQPLRLDSANINAYLAELDRIKNAYFTMNPQLLEKVDQWLRGK